MHVVGLRVNHERGAAIGEHRMRVVVEIHTCVDQQRGGLALLVNGEVVPGGRPFTLSRIVTPPFFASLMVAVPIG